MRVIVCGGRELDNVAYIWASLDRVYAEKPFTHFMQGGARGVDAIAREWAITKPGIETYVCKADWDKHGKAAGPLRNAHMLEWKPNLVIAFPGGRGTADMVRRAKAAKIPVKIIAE
jgi:hypothetical protein